MHAALCEFTSPGKVAIAADAAAAAAVRLEILTRLKAQKVRTNAWPASVQRDGAVRVAQPTAQRQHSPARSRTAVAARAATAARAASARAESRSAGDAEAARRRQDLAMQRRTHLRRKPREDEELEEDLFDVDVLLRRRLDAVARPRRIGVRQRTEFARVDDAIGVADVALVGDDDERYDGAVVVVRRRRQLPETGNGGAGGTGSGRRQHVTLGGEDLLLETSRLVEALPIVDAVDDDEKIS